MIVNDPEPALRFILFGCLILFDCPTLDIDVVEDELEAVDEFKLEGFILISGRYYILSFYIIIIIIIMILFLLLLLVEKDVGLFSKNKLERATTA